MEKEKYRNATRDRGRTTFVTHFFRGMGTPVELWSHTFSPKTYPGNDVNDAWSEVGGLLADAVRDFDQKESA